MKILRAIKELFFYNPLTKSPVANRNNYIKLFDEVKQLNHKNIDDLEKEYGYKINKFFLEELALETQITIKKSINNYQHGRVLYSVLSNYVNQKKNEEINILELGTARGFSAICMAKALDNLSVKGTIVTCDIIPHKKKIFWNAISDHDNKKKTREELILKWNNLFKYINFFHGDINQIIKKTKFNRINFAFIDAQHEYLDVKKEFEFISNLQKKGDIIIFDDIQEQFPGIGQLLDEIDSTESYEIKKIFSTSKRGYGIAKKK